LGLTLAISSGWLAAIRYQPEPTPEELAAQQPLNARLGSLVGSNLQSLAARLAPFRIDDERVAVHPWAKMARVPVIMYHDIVPEKEVFFDVTPAELEADFAWIRDRGLTPISLEALVAHLKSGLPLPEQPILLTFDDGYGGHYTDVYPLLKKYNYPAVFSVYPKGVGDNSGRLHASWDEWREMAANPLVTIAAHSLTHPLDLRGMSDDELKQEIFDSKQVLETELGIPIRYFTYPVGHYDARVLQWTKAAGYEAALTMQDGVNRFASETGNLFAIDRIGQSALEQVGEQAFGGLPLPRLDGGFEFDAPIELERRVTIEGVDFAFIRGGSPITIHADTRYALVDIQKNSEAIAAVDGGFFSLKYLDSNVMIGPVLGRNTGEFVPGNAGENRLLRGRPLVTMGQHGVRFVPFDPDRHNTREGVEAEMPGLTDAFVGAAWLVRDGQPQPDAAFGDLFDFNAQRHRAFWGIDRTGRPVVGVSLEPVGSVRLGQLLWQAGLWDAVMLDSGASTALAYDGESLVGYEPRPVPHAVGLVGEPAGEPAPNNRP
jgi:peptidoglycan/xylan/chitin deacetylase (PgdA/CDA1 family)